MICANKTDEDDCDLYFLANLPSYDVASFKIVPTEDPQKTNYVKGEKMSFFKLKETFHITSQKTLTIHKFGQRYDYTHCDKSSTNCQTESFTIKYNHYQSSRALSPQSNNYVFAPNKVTRRGSLPYNAPLSKTIHVGKLVTVV